MLAYYTSLVKKEDVLAKISMDAEIAATEANEIVCNLKSVSKYSHAKNIEDSLELISKSEELSKVINAMILNLKANLESYASSLVPQKVQEVEEEKPAKEEKQNPPEENSQLNGLMDAVKALKEIKDSLQ